MTEVNIETLVAGGDAPLLVLVPANTERHLVVDFLENLSLLEVAKAFRELTAHSDPAAERAAAADTLAASLAALAGLGGGVCTGKSSKAGPSTAWSRGSRTSVPVKPW